jgi:HAMP domain-containing protein
MRLHTKFNLMLLAVFSGSLVVTGWLSYNLLQKNARDEVIHNAGIGYCEQQAFYTFMGSLSGVFGLIFIVLNVMLNYVIVRPLAKMSRIADEISTGNMKMPEFEASGKDEIAVLSRSFNRLRRNLEKAMKMIED